MSATTDDTVHGTPRHPEPDDSRLLAEARYLLLVRAPYYASALFELIPVEVAGFGTFAVDKHWRLYFDPTTLREWGPQLSAGVLEHELGHLLRDHAARGDGVDDHGRWNAAGDLEINDDLAQCKVDLPDGCLYPSVYGLPDNQVAEWYYDHLPSDDAANGDTDDDGDGCGSGAGGDAASCELPADHPQFPARSHTEQEAARQATAEAVDRHQRSRGDVPAGLTAWAHQRLTPPTVPWRVVLASALRRAISHVAGQVDYTYRRPSRRQASTGVVMPSMHRPRPRVAVVLDTSGSMSDGDLTACLSEIDGVIRQAGVRGDDLRVIACDAAAHTAQRITTATEVSIVGRGGTDMRVGIDAALADRKHVPNVIVVLTDGYTPWPDRPPQGVRLICAVLKGGPTTTPRWATRVEVG